jgi:hypothetical protein
MLKLSVVAMLLVSSVASAAPEEPPRPDDAMKMFQEGTTIFNRDISPLRDDLQRQCVGDPSQKWGARLDAIDAKIAKMAKPNDKRQLVEYMAVLRPWVETKMKLVPDVGTWADAQAVVKAMIDFAKVVPPPAGESDAEMKAMMAYTVKARSVMAKADKALGYAQTKIFACEEFLGKPADLFPVRTKINENMQSLEAGLTKYIRAIAQSKFEPLRTAMSRMKDVSKEVGSWDAHVAEVSGAFEGLAIAKDIIANEDLYLALADYDSTQYGAEWAVAEAKKLVTEFGPKIARLVEEVSFPNHATKDAAREKVMKKELAGKKVLNGPTNYGVVSKDTFTEIEGGIKYTAKRESGAAYYVVKPATWTGPVPDGIAAEDLCELRYFYLGRWMSGPPSFKPMLKKWNIGTERFVTPILCKNAKRITKLK